MEAIAIIPNLSAGRSKDGGTKSTVKLRDFREVAAATKLSSLVKCYEKNDDSYGAIATERRFC